MLNLTATSHTQVTGQEFACKILRLPATGKKLGDGQSTREEIQHEIDIMGSLDHPNVVHLEEYFLDKKKAYLVQELITGNLIVTLHLCLTPTPLSHLK